MLHLTIEEKKQLLKDAQQAFHDISTGNKARVVVDQNGQRVEFASANSDKLAAYIRQLELAVCTPQPGFSGGPARFIF